MRRTRMGWTSEPSCDSRQPSMSESLRYLLLFAMAGATYLVYADIYVITKIGGMRHLVSIDGIV